LIQCDFDNFANRIRCLGNNYNPEEDNAPNNLPTGNDFLNHKPPPKRQKTRYRVDKCTKIPAIEAFLTAVQSHIFKSVTTNKSRDNLPPDERAALLDWRRNVLFNPDSSVVMRMQDKGNRFIVVDKNEDIEKAQIQIDRSSFRLMNTDLTKEHIKIVCDWAEKWHSLGQIDKSWRNFVRNPDAVPGKNSTLYKTHKESVPVRLLTTGCNTATENLSIFVEKHTGPLAQLIPSRIKDTDHFLDIIDEINQNGLPDNASLVSFDIVNMFPSISNESGIRAVRQALNSRKVKSPSTKCIIEGLKITLSCNNSKFNDNHLLQIDGTAMGAPNSCSYADLATVPIDDLIFESQKRDFTELYLYKKFRDDVFSLWTGDVYRLDDFLDFINTLDTNIKFTMEIGVLFKPDITIPLVELQNLIDHVFPNSPVEILRKTRFEFIEGSLFSMWSGRIADIHQFCLLLQYHVGVKFDAVIGKHLLRFLDVEVSKRNNALATTVYSKPTSSHMYLHKSSCHTLGCKNGIAKGVALRLRRLCSSDSEFFNQSELYKSFLISRGHDIKVVEKEFAAVATKSRQEVRRKTHKKSPGKAFFIAQFNPRGPSISQIIKNHSGILQNDPVASKVFPVDSIKIINKRCQNLKELLVRADPYNIAVPDNSRKGTVSCGKCDACKFLVHSDSFVSSATGYRFSIKKSMSCHTPHIVYLATCKKCNKQGVGSTDNFHTRLSTYKTHAKSKITCCHISKHWNFSCRHPNDPSKYMQFQIIDCVDNFDKLTPVQINNTLLDKERFWIGHLVTMHHGLNSTHDWHRLYRKSYVA
jgi:hypothetical protein